MDKFIAIVVTGYIFNWFLGLLILLAARDYRKWFFLLIPYGFMYLAYKYSDDLI